MKLSALKASALDVLHEAHSAAQIIEWATGGRFNDPEGSHLITIEHRGLVYAAGKWSGWQGPYWLVEVRTGIVFYGSLSYLRDVIKLCSKAFYAPDAEEW